MEGGGSGGEEPANWDELYSINLMPSEFFLKFRKELEGFRVGVNLEVLFVWDSSGFCFVYAVSLSILFICGR